MENIKTHVFALLISPFYPKKIGKNNSFTMLKKYPTATIRGPVYTDFYIKTSENESIC